MNKIDARTSDLRLVMQVVAVQPDVRPHNDNDYDGSGAPPALWTLWVSETSSGCLI